MNDDKYTSIDNLPNDTDIIYIESIFFYRNTRFNNLPVTLKKLRINKIIYFECDYINENIFESKSKGSMWINNKKYIKEAKKNTS